MKDKIEALMNNEVLAAEIAFSPDVGENEIDTELQRVNTELQKYTNNAGYVDYGFAIAGGILAGVIDSLYVRDLVVSDSGIALSHEQINHFIQKYAKSRGFDRNRLKDSIGDLEKAFEVAQDNVWKGAQIGVSAKNHHLADIAHHPTPLGLIAAIAVQFLRFGTFVSRDGKIHFLPVETKEEDIRNALVPAVLTGLLNWLVSLAEKELEEEHEIPEYIKKLARFLAHTPILIEIAKCADNWFGHLVSDMGGSKNTAGQGMGIPGVFISMLYEVAALPVFQNSGLANYLNNLYVSEKVDLRHELELYKGLGKQAVPVIFNEIFVRASYLISRLVSEIDKNHGVKGINWGAVIPVGNRTVDRMMTIASMTFTIADTSGAAVSAAIESGGNWVLFAGKFATKVNYIGIGRATISIVKEINSEQKEAQLIHEKMLLTQAHSEDVVEKLQEYKASLEEKLSAYLADDIDTFLSGFDTIREGISQGNSDLVMKGNITIQRVLGKEQQFTTQDEFDEFMDSDLALQF